MTGVINMRQEYDYADEVGQANLRYLYLPTQDNTAPSLEHLQQGVAFIKRELEEHPNGAVYIHCWEGLGRGPTMAAAYFVATGCTPDEAWAQIRKIRPFIRPTLEQIAQLERYAESLHPAAPAAPQAKIEEIKVPTPAVVAPKTDPAP